jgi:hypothetical protein
MSNCPAISSTGKLCLLEDTPHPYHLGRPAESWPNSEYIWPLESDADAASVFNHIINNLTD